ncbi:MAG: undecaprenyl-diphosphate phosphatase [Candidatus Dojkabacteria bacterium]
MLEAIILGIIQGLTELFPVSSSGHLLLVPEISKALGLDLDFSFQDTSFDITLHVATFFAILIAYWAKVKPIIFQWKEEKTNKLRKNLVLSSLPLAIPALIFAVFSDDLVKNNSLATFMLISIGAALIATEVYVNKRGQGNSYLELNKKSALVIGFFQAFAAVRGTSRSGITLIGGVLTGLSKKEALDYAFLAGLPVFAALSILDLIDIITNGTGEASFVQVVAGFSAAFLSSLAVITFFRKIIGYKWSLSIFGIYRIAIGLLLVTFIL